MGVIICHAPFNHHLLLSQDWNSLRMFPSFFLVYLYYQQPVFGYVVMIVEFKTRACYSRNTLQLYKNSTIIKWALLL